MEFLRILSAAGLTLGIVPSIIAQSATLPDRPVCAACQITVASAGVRLVDNETTLTGMGRFIGSLGGGFFIASHRGAPRIYDQTGKFVKQLGRTGSGPGEFQAPLAYARGPGDSLAVVDVASGTVNVYDRALTFRRSVRLPQTVVNGGFLWLPSGSFAVSGIRASARDIGFTIHLYGRGGEWLKSLAEVREPIETASSGMQPYRLLGLLDDGNIVSVTITGRYVIQVWNPRTGVRVHEYRREADWFDVTAGPFRPRVVGAQIDGAGRLWTLSFAIAPSWMKGVRRRTTAGENSFEVVDRDQVGDSVIEVVDLARGQLLAQLRVDRLFMALLPGPRVAAEADDDSAGLSILPVVLRSP